MRSRFLEELEIFLVMLANTLVALIGCPYFMISAIIHDIKERRRRG